MKLQKIIISARLSFLKVSTRLGLVWLESQLGINNQNIRLGIKKICIIYITSIQVLPSIYLLLYII